MLNTSSEYLLASVGRRLDSGFMIDINIFFSSLMIELMFKLMIASRCKYSSLHFFEIITLNQ